METHNLENNPKRYGEAEEVHHIRGEVVDYTMRAVSHEAQSEKAMASSNSWCQAYSLS